MQITLKSSLKYTLLGCILFMFACQQNTKQEAAAKVSKPFMDMQSTTTPLLLAPSILALPFDEYNGTFSPDGTLFYFTTYTSNKGFITYSEFGEDKVWSSPKIASFSGTYSEYDPLFSPDGLRLYFSSERPVNGKTAQYRTNIWYIEKSNDGWSAPIYVDLKEGGNYFSSITNEGAIYFNQWKNGDLFKYTNLSDSAIIERLPAPINTANDEGDPFIAPEEDYLIFRAYEGGLGRGDLFITYQIDGQWTEPENLGAPINSSAHEMCPYVTTDGKFFIFASSRLQQAYEAKPGQSLDSLLLKNQSYDNGKMNIYYISADFIEQMKAKHLQ